MVGDLCRRADNNCHPTAKPLVGSSPESKTKKYPIYVLSPVLSEWTPPVSRPTGFRATPGDTQVTLAWTDPGNTAIIKYQYRQKTGSGNAGDYGAWTDIPSSDDTTTSHNVTDLDNDTVYTFQVRAVSIRWISKASYEQSARPTASVWSATLTVDEAGGERGCSNISGSDLDNCSTTTVLSDDDFVYGNVTYTISQVALNSSNQLFLTFTMGQPAAIKTALGSLTLRADGQQLMVSSASVFGNVPRLRWTTNLGWTDGQVVNLSLREPEPQITDVRLKDNDRRFGVPMDVINRGISLFVEVEYDRTVSYDDVNRTFPLALDRGGAALYSEEEYDRMGYKGEPSKTDPQIVYAEFMPDLVLKCVNTGSNAVAADSKCTCKPNHQALCVDPDTPANPQTNCACWYHHWEMRPAGEGSKVIRYKYTVRWGDFDGDGVSLVHPATGAVLTFPQKVDGYR